MISCGLLLFLSSVFFLSLYVQKFSILPGKRFSVDVAKKLELSYFDMNGQESRQNPPNFRRSRKSMNESGPYSSSTKRIKLWVVIGPMGVIVREHSHLNSKIVGQLPSGSIAIGDISNSTLAFLYDDSRSIVSGTESTRLFISFPLQGWVSTNILVRLGNSIKVQHLLEPLQLKRIFQPIVDKRCSEDTFLTFTDFKGGDVTTIDQPLNLASASECCNACSTEIKCTAWTFTEENTCWLKDDSHASSPSQINLISGNFIKRIVSNKINPERNKIIQNNFKGSYRVSASCCSNSNSKVLDKNNDYFLFLSDVIRNKSLHGDYNHFRNSLLLSNENKKLNENSISSQFQSIKSKNVSPSILKITRDSIDWTSQWPVGTGKFGALIGGVLHQEIIPLSISGFFIIKNEENLPFDEIIENDNEDNNNDKVSADLFQKPIKEVLNEEKRGEKNNNGKKTTPYVKAFRLARKHLSNRKIVEAEDAIKNMQQSGLGMFQYVGDLSFIFSSNPLFVKESQRKQQQEEQAQEEQEQQQQHGQKHGQIEDNENFGEKESMSFVFSKRKSVIMSNGIRSRNSKINSNIMLNQIPGDSVGRDVLLDNMFNSFETKLIDNNIDIEEKQQQQQQQQQEKEDRINKNKNGKGNKNGFGSVHHSEGILDMRYGIAHSSFIEEIVLTDVAETEGDKGREDEIKMSDKLPGDRVDNLKYGEINKTGKKRNRYVEYVKSGNSMRDGKDKSSMRDGTDKGDDREDVEDEEEEVRHSGLRMHHREWFASHIDSVLVGVVSCSDIDDKSSSGDLLGVEASNCLNVAVRLTRDPGTVNPVPPTTIQVEGLQNGSAFGRVIDSFEGRQVNKNKNKNKNKNYSEGNGKERVVGKSSSIENDDSLEKENKDDEDAFAIQMVIKAGNGLILPTVVSCGVIVCRSNRFLDEELIDNMTNEANDNAGLGRGRLKGNTSAKVLVRSENTGGNLVYIRNSGRTSRHNSDTKITVPAVTCNLASSLEILLSIVESEGTSEMCSKN